ncbi:MAG: hypothetical protein HGA38_00420 [Candidatus Moranbacteria bacterium]|nr:hypothetical protein [Candidatus Moranbacteria bacterium]NTW46210.1 hypothetical protein [Candidatus Moranbacteria bacterium]
MIPDQNRPKIIITGKTRTTPVLDQLASRLSGLFQVEIRPFDCLVPKCFSKSRTPGAKAVSIAHYLTSTVEVPDDTAFILGIGFTAEKLQWNDQKTGEELLCPDTKIHLDEMITKLSGYDYLLNVGCSLLTTRTSVTNGFIVEENLCVRSLSKEERNEFVESIPKARLGKVGPVFPFRETDEWTRLLTEPEPDIEIITDRILRQLSEHFKKEENPLGERLLKTLVPTDESKLSA